jgi:hypothetical protein
VAWVLNVLAIKGLTFSSPSLAKGRSLSPDFALRRDKRSMEAKRRKTVTTHPTQPPEISPAHAPPQWDESEINQDIYECNFDQSISW